MKFPNVNDRVDMKDEKWKEKLPEKVYYIMRQRGTEKPYTGKFYKHSEKGIYLCAACGNPLFSSEAKFDSSSGWPSFYKPFEKGRVEEEKDRSLNMERTEVHCSRCGGHLGHVFEDGPEPTGLRYCINSKSLNFLPGD